LPSTGVTTFAVPSIGYIAQMISESPGLNEPLLEKSAGPDTIFTRVFAYDSPICCFARQRSSMVTVFPGVPCTEPLVMVAKFPTAPWRARLAHALTDDDVVVVGQAELDHPEDEDHEERLDERSAPLAAAAAARATIAARGLGCRGGATHADSLLCLVDLPLDRASAPETGGLVEISVNGPARGRRPAGR